MAKYAVVKWFGHFEQQWYIDAESEEEAWSKAEKEGTRYYQFVYREPKDLDSKGYVINLDEKKKKESPIEMKQYYEWMREAIEKGMIVTPEEHQMAFGLPFHNVW